MKIGKGVDHEENMMGSDLQLNRAASNEAKALAPSRLQNIMSPTQGSLLKGEQPCDSEAKKRGTKTRTTRITQPVLRLGSSLEVPKATGVPMTPQKSSRRIAPVPVTNSRQLGPAAFVPKATLAEMPFADESGAPWMLRVVTNETQPFSQRLYALLNLCEARGSKAVSWVQDGKAFKLDVSQKDELEALLSTYFTHKKPSSLIRQLNLYGFKNQNPCWFHPNFTRDGANLALIKRRKPEKGSGGMPLPETRRRLRQLPQATPTPLRRSPRTRAGSSIGTQNKRWLSYDEARPKEPRAKKAAISSVQRKPSIKIKIASKKAAKESVALPVACTPQEVMSQAFLVPKPCIAPSMSMSGDDVLDFMFKDDGKSGGEGEAIHPSISYPESYQTQHDHFYHPHSGHHGFNTQCFQQSWGSVDSNFGHPSSGPFPLLSTSCSTAAPNPPLSKTAGRSSAPPRTPRISVPSKTPVLVTGPAPISSCHRRPSADDFAAMLVGSTGSPQPVAKFLQREISIAKEMEEAQTVTPLCHSDAKPTCGAIRMTVFAPEAKESSVDADNNLSFSPIHGKASHERRFLDSGTLLPSANQSASFASESKVALLQRSPIETLGVVARRKIRHWQADSNLPFQQNPYHHRQAHPWQAASQSVVQQHSNQAHLANMYPQPHNPKVPPEHQSGNYHL